VLKPSRTPPKFVWAPMRDILRVGLTSSVVSLSTKCSASRRDRTRGLVSPAAVGGLWHRRTLEISWCAGVRARRAGFRMVGTRSVLGVTIGA